MSVQTGFEFSQSGIPGMDDININWAIIAGGLKPPINVQFQHIPGAIAQLKADKNCGKCVYERERKRTLYIVLQVIFSAIQS